MLISRAYKIAQCCTIQPIDVKVLHFIEKIILAERLVNYKIQKISMDIESIKLSNVLVIKLEFLH